MKKQSNQKILMTIWVLCCFVALASGVLRSFLLLNLLGKLATIVATLGLIFIIVKGNLKTIFLGFLAVCFCLSIFTTEWPLRLSFAISKASLSSAVTSRNDATAFPRWCGAVRVTAVESLDGGDWLLTKNGFDQAGYAKVESVGKPEGYRVKIDLSDGWCYLVDD